MALRISCTNCPSPFEVSPVVAGGNVPPLSLLRLTILGDQVSKERLVRLSVLKVVGKCEERSSIEVKSNYRPSLALGKLT